MCNFPKYLDDFVSLFVSSTFLLFRASSKAVFCQTGIAQSPADVFKFSQQLAQAVSVGGHARLFEFMLYFLLSTAVVNAAQRADRRFQDFGGKFFILFQQDPRQHPAIALG